MKKNILLLSICLTPFIAFSQEGFEYATTSKDGVDYYYRIENDLMGFSKEIWLKYNNPIKKIKTKSGKYVSKGGGFTMAFMNIGCSSKTHETKNIIVYNKNGDVIERDDMPTFPKQIVPGSVIESIYHKVCAK